MKELELNYTPTQSPHILEERLGRLLLPGPIADSDMASRLTRLERLFRVYTSAAPHPHWAPGVATTGEMRRLAELYLPIEEISRAFTRLFARALKFTPFMGASSVHSSVTWLDALERLEAPAPWLNSARLLSSLMEDGEIRTRFIFANFLPRRYGGAFDRYPAQHGFLKEWLEKNRQRLRGRVRCLDAACGTGEGTFELAMLLLEIGFYAEEVQVHGSTLEPLELFAAAHAFFPHDPPREAAYRKRLEPICGAGAEKLVSFGLEDLSRPDSREDGLYDVVLCNGILGGPFLWEKKSLEEAVGRLAQRVGPGGIFLAADRFHGGWRKVAPVADMLRLLQRCGLQPVETGEGAAAVRSG